MNKNKLSLIEFDTAMGRVSFKIDGIYRNNKKIKKDNCEIAEIVNQIWLAGYFEGRKENEKI